MSVPRGDDLTKPGADGDPVPGNPQVLQGIVDDFTYLRDTAWSVCQGLDAFMASASGGGFEGASADALRGVVSGRLKTFLDNIVRAFSLAGEAVAAYRLTLVAAQRVVSGVMTETEGMRAKAPGFAGLKKQVQDQRSQVVDAEQTMIQALRDAAQMVSQPVKMPSLFDKIWQGLETALGIGATILALLSMLVDGPLGLMAAGLGAAGVVMSATDLARHRTVLKWFLLSLLGLMAPETKGLFNLEQVGAAFRGMVGGVGTAAGDLAHVLTSPGAMRAFLASVPRYPFRALRGLGRIPVMVGRGLCSVAPAVPPVIKAISGWVARDFAHVAKWYPSLSAAVAPYTAYAVVNLGRTLGALFTPMRFGEMAESGFRGAWAAWRDRASLTTMSRGLSAGWNAYGARAGLAGLRLLGQLHDPRAAWAGAEAKTVPGLLMPGPTRFGHPGPGTGRLAEPLPTPVPSWTVRDLRHGAFPPTGGGLPAPVTGPVRGLDASGAPTGSRLWLPEGGGPEGDPQAPPPVDRLGSTVPDGGQRTSTDELFPATPQIVLDKVAQDGRLGLLTTRAGLLVRPEGVFSDRGRRLLDQFGPHGIVRILDGTTPDPAAIASTVRGSGTGVRGSGTGTLVNRHRAKPPGPVTRTVAPDRMVHTVTRGVRLSGAAEPLLDGLSVRTTPTPDLEGGHEATGRFTVAELAQPLSGRLGGGFTVILSSDGARLPAGSRLHYGPGADTPRFVDLPLAEGTFLRVGPHTDQNQAEPELVGRGDGELSTLPLRAERLDDGRVALARVPPRNTRERIVIDPTTGRLVEEVIPAHGNNGFWRIDYAAGAAEAFDSEGRAIPGETAQPRLLPSGSVQLRGAARGGVPGRRGVMLIVRRALLARAPQAVPAPSAAARDMDAAGTALPDSPLLPVIRTRTRPLTEIMASGEPPRAVPDPVTPRPTPHRGSRPHRLRPDQLTTGRQHGPVAGVSTSWRIPPPLPGHAAKEQLRTRWLLLRGRLKKEQINNLIGANERTRVCPTGENEPMRVPRWLADIEMIPRHCAKRMEELVVPVTLAGEEFQALRGVRVWELRLPDAATPPRRPDRAGGSRGAPGRFAVFGFLDVTVAPLAEDLSGEISDGFTLVSTNTSDRFHVRVEEVGHARVAYVDWNLPGIGRLRVPVANRQVVPRWLEVAWGRHDWRPQWQPDGQIVLRDDPDEMILDPHTGHILEHEIPGAGESERWRLNYTSGSASRLPGGLSTTLISCEEVREGRTVQLLQLVDDEGDTLLEIAEPPAARHVFASPAGTTVMKLRGAGALTNVNVVRISGQPGTAPALLLERPLPTTPEEALQFLVRQVGARTRAAEHLGVGREALTAWLSRSLVPESHAALVLEKVRGLWQSAPERQVTLRADGGVRVSGGVEGTLHFTADGLFAFRTVAIRGTALVLRFADPDSAGEDILVQVSEQDGKPAKVEGFLVRDEEGLTLRVAVPGREADDRWAHWHFDSLGVLRWRDVPMAVSGMPIGLRVVITYTYSPQGAAPVVVSYEARLRRRGADTPAHHFEAGPLPEDLAAQYPDGFTLTLRSNGRSFHFDGMERPIVDGETPSPVPSIPEPQPTPMDIDVPTHESPEPAHTPVQPPAEAVSGTAGEARTAEHTAEVYDPRLALQMLNAAGSPRLSTEGTPSAPSRGRPPRALRRSQLPPGGKLSRNQKVQARVRLRVLLRSSDPVAIAQHLRRSLRAVNMLLRGAAAGSENLALLIERTGRAIPTTASLPGPVNAGAGETLHLTKKGDFRYRTLRLPAGGGALARFAVEGVAKSHHIKIVGPDGTPVPGAEAFDRNARTDPGVTLRKRLPGTNKSAEWQLDKHGVLRSHQVPVTGPGAPQGLRIRVTHTYRSDPVGHTRAYEVLSAGTDRPAAGFDAKELPERLAARLPGGIALRRPAGGVIVLKESGLTVPAGLFSRAELADMYAAEPPRPVASAPVPVRPLVPGQATHEVYRARLLVLSRGRSHREIGELIGVAGTTAEGRQRVTLHSGAVDPKEVSRLLSGIPRITELRMQQLKELVVPITWYGEECGALLGVQVWELRLPDAVPRSGGRFAVFGPANIEPDVTVEPLAEELAGELGDGFTLVSESAGGRFHVRLEEDDHGHLEERAHGQVVAADWQLAGLGRLGVPFGDPEAVPWWVEVEPGGGDLWHPGWRWDGQIELTKATGETMVLQPRTGDIVEQWIGGAEPGERWRLDYTHRQAWRQSDHLRTRLVLTDDGRVQMVDGEDPVWEVAVPEAVRRAFRPPRSALVLGQLRAVDSLRNVRVVRVYETLGKEPVLRLERPFPQTPVEQLDFLRNHVGTIPQLADLLNATHTAVRSWLHRRSVPADRVGLVAEKVGDVWAQAPVREAVFRPGGGVSVSGGVEGTLHFTADGFFGFRTVGIRGTDRVLRFDHAEGVGENVLVQVAERDGIPLEEPPGYLVRGDGLTLRIPVPGAGAEGQWAQWHFDPEGAPRGFELPLVGDGVPPGLLVRIEREPEGMERHVVLQADSGGPADGFAVGPVVAELADELRDGFSVTEEATGRTLHFPALGTARYLDEPGAQRRLVALGNDGHSGTEPYEAMSPSVRQAQAHAWLRVVVRQAETWGDVVRRVGIGSQRSVRDYVFGHLGFPSRHLKPLVEAARAAGLRAARSPDGRLSAAVGAGEVFHLTETGMLRCRTLRLPGTDRWLCFPADSISQRGVMLSDELGDPVIDHQVRITALSRGSFRRELSVRIHVPATDGEAEWRVDELGVLRWREVPVTAPGTPAGLRVRIDYDYPPHSATAMLPKYRVRLGESAPDTTREGFQAGPLPEPLAARCPGGFTLTSWLPFDFDGIGQPIQDDGILPPTRPATLPCRGEPAAGSRCESASRG